MLLVDLSSDSAAPKLLSLLAIIDSSFFVPAFSTWTLEYYFVIFFQEKHQWQISHSVTIDDYKLHTPLSLLHQFTFFLVLVSNFHTHLWCLHLQEFLKEFAVILWFQKEYIEQNHLFTSENQLFAPYISARLQIQILYSKLQPRILLLRLMRIFFTEKMD